MVVADPARFVKIAPAVMVWLILQIRSVANCAAKSAALTIGPARTRGKNATYSRNSDSRSIAAVFRV